MPVLLIVDKASISFDYGEFVQKMWGDVAGEVLLRAARYYGEREWIETGTAQT